jgi:molecular chaperone DnaJ
VTLYDELGLPPTASAIEVRDAYRRRARQLHPDRGGRDAAAMAALNDAYRVLRDPARRVVYDQSLRQPAGSAAGQTTAPRWTAPSTTPSPVNGSVRRPPQPLPPARYPWKLVIGMFLIGVAVVLIGAALYEPAAEPPPDNLLVPGSCVVIEGNGDAREVNCGDGGGQLVVQALIPIDARCPTGTAGYRDRQGRGLACVITED